MEDEFDQREALFNRDRSTPGMRAPFSGPTIDMRELRHIGERIKPIVTETRLFEFNEDQIKQVLAKYVAETYGVDVDAGKVIGDYRAADYSGGQFDHSPGYCKFTVKVDG